MIAKQDRGQRRKEKKKNKRKGRQQSEGGTSFRWELVKKKKKGARQNRRFPSQTQVSTQTLRVAANVSPHQFRQSS